MQIEQPDKKNKVLFLLPGFEAGGAEMVTIRLMESLSKDSRYSVCIASLNGDGPLAETIPQNIPIHKAGMSRERIVSFFALVLLWGKEKPNIVFSTLTMMNFVACAIAYIFPNTKLIVREATLPSYFFQTYPYLSWIIRLLYKVLYRRAQIIIAPSTPVLKELQNIIGVDNKRFALLYNPVSSPQIFTPPSNTEIITFLSVGRLNFQKGLDALIQKITPETIPYNWEWLIVGDGPQEQELQKLINKSGLSDKIYLKGYDKYPQKYYKISHALLLPSRWEGMPNVALEALSYGLHVLSLSSAGGITEIAKLSPDNSVSVSNDIDSMIEVIREQKWQRHSKSLLPSVFQEDNVFKSFVKILEGV